MAGASNPQLRAGVAADDDTLAFIANYIQDYGPPTYSEIAKLMGRTRSTVAGHVNNLIFADRLHRDSSGRLVLGPPPADAAEPAPATPAAPPPRVEVAQEWVPVLQRVHLGMQRLPDRPHGWAPLPPGNIRGELFAIRASDDGMAAAGIPVLAWVYATLTTDRPVHDQLVVAPSSLGRTAIVRRFSRYNGGQLIAASPGFETLPADGESPVVGIVRGWFVLAS